MEDQIKLFLFKHQLEMFIDKCNEDEIPLTMLVENVEDFLATYKDHFANKDMFRLRSVVKNRPVQPTLAEVANGSVNVTNGSISSSLSSILFDSSLEQQATDISNASTSLYIASTPITNEADNNVEDRYMHVDDSYDQSSLGTIPSPPFSPCNSRSLIFDEPPVLDPNFVPKWRNFGQIKVFPRNYVLPKFDVATEEFLKMPVLVNKDFDAVIRAVVKTLSHDLRRYFIYKIPKSAVLSACLAFTNAYPNMATITKSFGHEHLERKIQNCYRTFRKQLEERGIPSWMTPVIVSLKKRELKKHEAKKKKLASKQV